MIHILTTFLNISFLIMSTHLFVTLNILVAMIVKVNFNILKYTCNKISNEFKALYAYTKYKLTRYSALQLSGLSSLPLGTPV